MRAVLVVVAFLNLVVANDWQQSSSTNDGLRGAGDDSSKRDQDVDNRTIIFYCHDGAAFKVVDAHRLKQKKEKKFNWKNAHVSLFKSEVNSHVARFLTTGTIQIGSRVVTDFGLTGVVQVPKKYFDAVRRRSANFNNVPVEYLTTLAEVVVDIKQGQKIGPSTICKNLVCDSLPTAPDSHRDKWQSVDQVFQKVDVSGREVGLFGMVPKSCAAIEKIENDKAHVVLGYWDSENLNAEQIDEIDQMKTEQLNTPLAALGLVRQKSHKMTLRCGWLPDGILQTEDAVTTIFYRAKNTKTDFQARRQHLHDFAHDSDGLFDLRSWTGAYCGCGTSRAQLPTLRDKVHEYLTILHFLDPEQYDKKFSEDFTRSMISDVPP